MKYISLLIAAFVISFNAWALPNDFYGRTVTGPVTANGNDTYTDTDPNTGAVFQMAFLAGTDQLTVYACLRGMAPSNTNNYVGLDANGNVVSPYPRYTQTMMDALVSGGTIASYQLQDPAFPPPPPGAQFNPGSGNGNFALPVPYLPSAPANWPPPGGVPNVLPQAIDQIANRLSTINPQSPARTLNSNFTPNANRPVFACYSIHMVCTVTVGQTCSAQVQLLSDTNTPPVAVRAQTLLSLAGTIVVGLTETTGHDAPVCYIVPKGHNVRLSSSSSGTATISIVQQTEEPLM